MDLLLPLFFLTTFIKITTLPHLVLSVDPQYEECAPESCSPLASPFSYPSWIHGQHPSYCGEPGFDISSEDKCSILRISGKTFMVVSLFDSNNSLLLIDEIAYKNSRGMPLSNPSLDGTPFVIPSGNYDLYFFNNCTTSPGVKSYPVSCATGPSLHSFADFYEASFMGCSGNYSCQFVISAPVDVRANESSVMAMSSIDVVKMGFLVNRKTNNCSECKGCGGRCGFEQNGLVCVCPDGPDQETGGNDGKHVRMKIGIGAGAGFVAMMSAVLFVLYMHRRKKYGKSSVFMRSMSSMYSSRTDFDKGGFSYDVPIFNYDELEKATNNFDPATEIGDGGFGTVFKGKLRDRRVVAVKRLYEHNCKRVEQFMNEVDILTRLRHPNLISLYGCTSRQSSRLLLVYEYIPNGTVADHIHGDLAKPGLPPWLTRLNIAVETSAALVYLHVSDVIHRDLKTSNILLDENFTVKVADFGLSRLFPLDVTHISTAPQGTPGYVDPEYHQCYQLTEKSDVYSFGVVLIELISSLPAVDIMRHRHEINLSALALSKIQANALHELVDANLGFQSDENTREMITAVAELAFQCLQPRHDERPSMQEVLEALKWIRKCGCKDEKADDGEDTSDDAVLLKNNPPILSPDSVTVKWVGFSSTSTTRNASA